MVGAQIVQNDGSVDDSTLGTDNAQIIDTFEGGAAIGSERNALYVMVVSLIVDI